MDQKQDQTIDDLLNSQKAKIAPASKETQDAFDDKMTEMDLRQKEMATEQEAMTRGLPYMNLKGFPIAADYLKLVPREKSKKYKIISFFKDPKAVRLAVVDPESPGVNEIIEDLKKQFFNLTIDIFLTSEHSFYQAYQLYEHVHIPKQIKRGVEIPKEEIEKYRKGIKSFREMNEKLKGTNVTQIFTIVLAGAIQAESSDVHIETEENELVVRYRIDGVLQNVATLRKQDWPKIISRVKLMAGLKLNITAVPQDGRITIYLTDGKIDVRVSTLPTAFGESIVMRLLMSSTVGIGFEELGIRGRAYEQVKTEVEKPNGMIITTGPTGSGKTTTLYAVINKLNTPETKIITLEDPIEYQVEGVNQSQVDHSKDYDFAKGLRSILRQDPDIIMVGEIRDKETAEVAIQSALTGHLVLSTIHTNDAAGAVPRFMAMGVKPFLLAPALNAIMAQRLVRKICDHCKEKVDLDGATTERIKNILGAIPTNSGEKIDLNQELTFYKGKGCEACHSLGYKGRIGIFEIFAMDKEIEKVIISEEVSEYRMKELAVQNGMVSMVQDGLLKAKDGITTVEEVFRVAQ
ncbi:MAG: GspE/PulE family protein [Patescibacteria group bacterium]